MIDLLNKIHFSDCVAFMKTLPDNCVDSIVTDPPYELGFMGKSWDNTGIANSVEMWTECLRVLKPGGYLLAFSGTRTYHRMACAIEDAGFEVRDMIEWVYGSGFPKSLNIGKAVDKLQGNEREVIGKNPNFRENSGENNFTKEGTFATTESMKVSTKGTSEREGRGTALKPAHEPICMARKPLSEKTVAENCLKWGTGGINIDESRVATEDKMSYSSSEKQGVTKFGTGTTEQSPLGRFPANLIHDNSEEVRECFPETKSQGNRNGEITMNAKSSGNIKFVNHEKGIAHIDYTDSGNASRFFKSIIYQAKASKSERNKGCEGLPLGEAPASARSKPAEGRENALGEPRANNHPTVKPIALMEYLIKMVTKEGGIVFDPFAGSGTTLVAAKKNGYQYLGTEMTKEYIPIIEARLNAQEEERGDLPEGVIEGQKSLFENI